MPLTDDQLRRIGRELFKGAWQYFALVLGLTLLLYVAIQWATGGLDYDDTDGHSTRSGMKLRTDYGTGCQYLETTDGGITPRLDSAGSLMCPDSRGRGVR